MDPINTTEKKIAAAYAIPLRTLQRCRKEKKFGSDVAFTAPHNHQVIYNIKNFEEWFDKNKQTAIWSLNKQMQKVISSLKDNGWWPDMRKKNGGDKWHLENQLYHSVKANHDSYERKNEKYDKDKTIRSLSPDKLDHKLADVYEKLHKKGEL